MIFIDSWNALFFTAKCIFPPQIYWQFCGFSPLLSLSLPLYVYISLSLQCTRFPPLLISSHHFFVVSMSGSSKKRANLIEKTPGSQPCFQVVKASNEQSVLLTDWWLIEVQSNSKGRRLGVAGFSSRGRQAIRNFKSTAIIKRHDAVTLETEDGITVVITNGVNMFRTLENDFPQEICKHFLSGFPYNWETFADKCVDKESTNKTSPSWTSNINDLPVAHVRDILMLSDGDSASYLIEKLISSYTPTKKGDDVNCDKTEGKHTRQEDSTDDSSRLFSVDVSDNATPKTQNVSEVEEKSQGTDTEKKNNIKVKGMCGKSIKKYSGRRVTTRSMSRSNNLGKRKKHI